MNGMSRLLENAAFELIPMKTTLEKAQTLPTGTTVSITASPVKGMGATVELAEELVAMGLDVIPHVSARLTKSKAELEGIVGRLNDIGVSRIFVVGGDADDPGDFFDAMALIRHLDTLDHPFTQIGVTGYPEGHPNIADDLLIQALVEKQPFASSVTTQMCFDVEAIRSWIVRIRSLGIDLPVVIGIPGVTELTKLIGISARIGVGTSLRFLSKNRSLATKLLRPYTPDELVDALAELADDPDLGVSGLHIYTFNQVETTLEWYLDRRTAVTGGP
ncbi:MAG: methylenetetrahydrofolate reductase [Acidimicrobiia bacterium]|nr:methylenetetrahydrofolate reductase [Acidimicrobiia bacterium]